MNIIEKNITKRNIEYDSIGDWWLRSSHSGEHDYVACIYYRGFIGHGFLRDEPGIVPFFVI